MQLTLLSLKIGKVFLTERRNNHWNDEVARRVGSKPEITHDIIQKFQRQGLVNGAREDTGRRRVLYLLTDKGAEVFGAALASLQLAST